MFRKILMGFILTSLVIISACKNNEVDNQEEVTLKVVYYDKNLFNQDYGNLFASRFPNIHIEVLPITYYSNSKNTDVDSIRKYIQDNEPDVVLLRDVDLKSLAQKGELVDLSPLIKKNKFDVDHLMPSVVELLKNPEDGDVYGLAPTFETSALYYNKDLFDRAGIDYPTDEMSWSDVLRLSQRFSGNDTAYGFYKGKNANLFNFVIMRIGYISGINYYNASTQKMTLNTDSWRSIFRSVIDAYKKNSIFLETSQEPKRFNFSDQAKIQYGSNLFIMGKAAMTLDTVDLVRDLESSKQKLNWGVATVPVDPTNPSVTNAFHLDRIFAINGQSQHVDAAWKLIEFINSDEVAKFKSKSTSDLSTRDGVTKEMFGHDIEAFYKLKPTGNFYTANPLPNDFYNEFMSFGNDELTKVIGGESTLDEALDRINQEGQTLLDKYTE